MTLNTKFVHKNFFFNQLDNQNIKKVQTAPIYSGLLSNKVYFIVTTQKINFAVPAVIKPKASFFLRLRYLVKQFLI